MRIPGAGRTKGKAAAPAAISGGRAAGGGTGALDGARVRARSKAKAALIAGAAGTALAVVLSGCGADGGGSGGSGGAKPSAKAERVQDPTKIPGVGDKYQSKIPAKSDQVVAVEGRGKDSADAKVRLYSRQGKKWSQERSWPAHNGKKGWTPSHRQGDKRSPVGVFTLSDAGGVLSDPGAKLPYAHTAAFTPPTYWPKKTRHDFDHVIAIDYNRVKGTSPLDPARPQGQAKGGSIWLHMDHGSGTSGCVSLSKSGMSTLLRTLDPAKHPVVVMGDKASLTG
ncbi:MULTISPECIES: L,D-transpeptidase family protein [unclassified Streptomyces]|uniref:L,D-transpeptidase family protein n=1 Tax=unclassified Streptomyces TaxID=2593676 RepID=UPI002DDC6652|nr:MULTISPECIES: L,D-transpeptidase family protein [unclassified Streptomyces]WSA90443.1 L,D-transpeptidase family protein [Streptomyces sp. NBC_01795]WSB74669.1 L,D-transpeptidase family protein [Streptomyces sp. NBC_01775]WSS16948.1 L,D-transpeptidase family protein [Streptomyces sp. NBC_01186]WSS45691.1 L,D-transpeptidase family protein [Streptomyces sp. NBC_01187]